jgi:hypothetical protein
MAPLRASSCSIRFTNGPLKSHSPYLAMTHVGCPILLMNRAIALEYGAIVRMIVDDLILRLDSLFRE